MDCPIALDQRGSVRPNDLAEGIVEGLLREVGVQPDERFAEAPIQDHVAVGGVGALGSLLAEGDVWPVSDGESGAGEPRQGGFFDY